MSIEKTMRQIKKHEGYRRKPYYCTANKLTIGYGRNLDDVGLSESEAEQLLINDLTLFDHNIKKHINICYCNSARLAVLNNMAYNLGLAGLLAFKQMLSHLESGRFEQAAHEMLDSRWARQLPKRSKELATQMSTGQWQSH